MIDKNPLMEEIIQEISICKRCALCETRTLTVPGEGNLHSPVVFVGEAPGREEDESGRPFVGQAGKLLMTILKAVELDRSAVYITNVVKCRPPENRVPAEVEMNACAAFILAQLEVIQPKLIVTLGLTSFSHFFGKPEIGMTQIRGQMYDWEGGIRVFSMFHPSYLLHNPSKEPGSPKAMTWADIQQVRRVYDEYK